MSWKPARRSTSRKRAARGQRFDVIAMGVVTRIEYRRKGQRGDTRSVHDFKRKATLYRTRDGRMLVVAPVKATHEIKD